MKCLIIIFIIICNTLISCGPSAESSATIEKYKQEEITTPKEKDKYDYTAFFLSVKSRNYGTLDSLIAIGIDINTKNQDQMTALMLASFDGDCELVKYLLNHNANVNAVDQIGRSAIIFSTYAAFNPDYCITKLLIEKGADVNTCDIIGLTPLMGSLDYQISELLIKNKANINIQSASGNTALHYTSRYGKKKLIELLLLNGSDIEIKNNEGEDALTIAKEQGNNEVINLLEKIESAFRP